MSTKKIAKKKSSLFMCLGDSAPPNPQIRMKLCPPHPAPDTPTPGTGRFWIEYPQSTGYWISLVSVSESGSQSRKHSRLNSHSTKNFEYKINHILKTKIRTTVKIGVPSASEHCASSGPIFFANFHNFLTILSNYI